MENNEVLANAVEGAVVETTKQGLSKKGKAGIAVAVVGGTVLLVLGVHKLLKNRKAKKAAAEQQTEDAE